MRTGAVARLPGRPEGGGQSFASVELVAGDEARAAGLEIVIGDATIRVGGGVAPALLAEAIRAVRSA